MYVLRSLFGSAWRLCVLCGVFREANRYEAIV